MSPTVEELKATLAGLSPAERAELAQFLLHTLDPADEGAEAEWLALAARRMEEIEAGKVQGIPADQLFDELRSPRR